MIRISAQVQICDYWSPQNLGAEQVRVTTTHAEQYGVKAEWVPGTNK